MANEDPAYLMWLREQDCAWCRIPPWFATVQAHHHTGKRSHGKRAHDHDAFPLCVNCHDSFHSGKAQFKDWTRAQRRAWQDEQVTRYRVAWAALHDESLF